MQSIRKYALMLIYTIAFALIIFSLQRLLFFFINIKHFTHSDTSQILQAFVSGLRFDFSAILMVFLPFFILLLLAAFTKSKIYSKLIFFVFLFSLSIAVLANSIDAAYFDFTLKRSTADVFFMTTAGNDFIRLLPLFITDFWYVVLIWLLLTLSGFWFYKKFLTKKFPEKNNLKNGIKATIVNVIMLGTIAVVGIRGGFQLKPIEIVNAGENVPSQLVPLVLNTPFCIIKTFGNTELEEVNYFTSDELDRIYTPIHRPLAGGEFKKKNVLIIVLESFSREYIRFFNPAIAPQEKSFTPFLDSLLSQCYVFPNSFANGRKSIEAIPAIVASLPALMDNPYISSQFAANNLEALPTLLKKKGYYSAFFHGGNNGTMGFEAFSHVAGFDQYFGRNEYANDADFDGKWGIYDEPFFLWTADKLSASPKPFLALLFSLSSHHPYPVPEKYKDRFRNGKHPILRSIQYTDFALSRFFNKVSQTDWFKNTVFVITADHAFEAISETYKTRVNDYAIPIAFYVPADTAFRGSSDRIAQQTDIMPTLLSILNYNEPFFAYGNNLFDTLNKSGFAINYINGSYQLITDSFSFIYYDDERYELYNLRKDPLMKENLGINKKLTLEYTKLVKAIKQSFNFALVKNCSTANAYESRKEAKN